MIMLSICAFTACGQQRYTDDSSVNESISSTENYDSGVEDEPVISEQEQLYGVLDSITSITDYRLLRHVNDFYSIAISASLSSNPDSAMEKLLAIQSETDLIFDELIETRMPEGYGLQDSWNNLIGSCVSLRNNLYNAIEALQDNDSSRVMELREIAGNTDIFESAVVVQNVLTAAISELQENEEKEGIEVICSYEKCKEKAAKYARYHFDNSDITGDDLMGASEPVVVKDIPGKHYAFYFDNIIIFINVEDCSIVCRETTANGYRDNYVNDGVLPAEGDDVVMPDIIGMDYEEAKALLKSMGIKYNEGGGMDTDAVPEGTVAHCYPSPGNAVTEDTTVNIIKEMDVTN